MRLTELKGIGEKTEATFIDAGIQNVMDLLFFFPRDYELFCPPETICEIGMKSFVTLRGTFAQGVFERKTPKISILQATFKDEIGDSIRTVWFNAPFIKKKILPGVPYIIRGRVSRKYGISQIDQPKVYTLAEYDQVQGSLQPVYSISKGLSNNIISKAVSQALETSDFLLTDVEDFIPQAVRKKYNLSRRSSAVKNMHFPADREAFAAAVSRMSFEEIFLFIYLMKISGSNEADQSNIIINASNKTGAFINSLPFKLTDAQNKVIDEIEHDMSSGMVMNRLIQGDVGSGKTIVALIALMNAAFAGYQGAMMAPTEVLAAQHYETITGLFKQNGVSLNVALLTGSMSALEKRVVYDALKNGKIDILVGTHALIQEKVRFSNLGMVITDEQHRFGLKQRQAFADKGNGNIPHMLVMSATPIPRTLALIVYGNMHVSVIDQVPASRKPIKNAVVDDSFHANAYKFITNQIKAGHQAYIICPLVEYSDGLDAANVEDYTQLLREVLDPSIRIGKLTGPMPTGKKNEVMSKFAAGEIDVLVSTTVIEVGVDVPNATVMMIEDANRFGLATLHQLRGRVGRGKDQSYCIFVSNNRSEEAMERLSILNDSNNGFEIAAKDLEMRGPGEFLGIRQSGALSFKCFDVFRDAELAAKASEAANDIISGRITISTEEKVLLDEKSQRLQGRILL